MDSIVRDSVRHTFRYVSNVPLNDENFDCRVNVLESWEEKPKEFYLLSANKKLLDKVLIGVYCLYSSNWAGWNSGLEDSFLEII